MNKRFQSICQIITALRGCAVIKPPQDGVTVNQIMQKSI